MHSGAARQHSLRAADVLNVLESASSSPVTFIGVDLAWRSEGHHSGIVVLRGDGAGASLVAASTGIESVEAAAEYVERYAGENTVVAVDAPLIIRNETGQRPCETEIARRFSRFHAAAHSTSLSLYADPAGPRLVRLLARHGFAHDLDLQRAQRRQGRWLLEVYPHPAMVVLFGLARIIKYKKGSIAERLNGLHRLRQHLRSLRQVNPALRDSPALAELLGRNAEQLRGAALKQYEDTLDALFCAYLALFCWRWGAEGNEMIGDLETGYVVLPARRLDESVCGALARAAGGAAID